MLAATMPRSRGLELFLHKAVPNERLMMTS